MQKLIKAPKGTKDVLPFDSYKWQYIENILKNTAHSFGISEIRFPTFEHTELFLRGVGDTTDVVSKEMYTFRDKGERSITLRPEGTASTVRAFLENSLNTLPLKVYYIAPNFRYEKPEAGRLREHHQFGIEYFGVSGAIADSEIICIVDTFLKKLGINNITAHINTIGCPHCRPNYHKKLHDFLSSKKNQLCTTCDERFEKNPLRILDCKNTNCNEITKDAPLSIDNLCQECESHFENLKQNLDNLEIKYIIDTGIVRGLDYYSKTVFEFVSNDIGAKGTICGGGRYDGLVEILGGSHIPAIGFGCGIERLIMLMENLGLSFGDENHVDIFIANMGNLDFVQKLAMALRKIGIKTSTDLAGKSLKNQMKYADKISAKFCIVVGDDEIKNSCISVKNMKTGEEKQSNFNANDIAKIILEA